MANKQLPQLVEFIKQKGFVLYSEVKYRAFEINPKWRPETWTRGLRERKDIIGEDRNGNQPTSHSPLVNYRYIFDDNKNTDRIKNIYYDMDLRNY